MRLILLVLIALAACTEPNTATDTLALQLADTPLQLTAPTSVLLQIVVVGADGNAVSVSSPDLPPFASLQGTLLTLAPGYEDVGSYAIELDATTSQATATGVLSVQVTRSNTGPYFLMPMFVNNGVDGNPVPHLLGAVCDKEGDNFTYEVEIVSVDQALANVATYTKLIDFSVTPPVPYVTDASCAEPTFDLGSLPTGQYHGAVHAYDVLGAEDPYGWVPISGVLMQP